MIEFRKAQRNKSKLRLALAAPSGYGKTYSALRIAKGLGGKVAMIDTENGSGDLYANDFEYDIVTMNAPYLPEKYILAIEAAEEAGYDVIIIDSLSHAWAGEGGLLDKHGKLADKGGNSFAAWRTITPDHNRLVEAMLKSKSHIIATMRSKTDYVIEGGKPVKVGLAPVQRDGVEYEFTCVMELDKEHNGFASKDRTSLFDGKIAKMDEKIGQRLLEWLNTGAKDEKVEEKKELVEEAFEEPFSSKNKVDNALNTAKKYDHTKTTSPDNHEPLK